MMLRELMRCAASGGDAAIHRLGDRRKRAVRAGLEASYLAGEAGIGA